MPENTTNNSLFEHGVQKKYEIAAYTAFAAGGKDLDEEWSRYSREVAEPDWRRKSWIKWAAILSIWAGGMAAGWLVGGFLGVIVTLWIFLLGCPLAAACLHKAGAFTNKGIYEASERADCADADAFCFALGGLWLAFLTLAIVGALLPTIGR